MRPVPPSGCMAGPNQRAGGRPARRNDQTFLLLERSRFERSRGTDAPNRVGPASISASDDATRLTHSRVTSSSEPGARLPASNRVSGMIRLRLVQFVTIMTMALAVGAGQQFHYHIWCHGFQVTARRRS